MVYPNKDAYKTARTAMNALRNRLRWTRFSIGVERLATCFWPLISWTLFVFAVIQLKIMSGFEQTTALIVIGFAAVCWLYLFAKGVRRYQLPTQEEARTRLDQALPGRPLETLGDQPAIGRDDAVSQHLWARHLTRMADLAKSSKAAVPNIRLSRRDPWAFRLLALFLFAGAFIFVRSDPVHSISDSLGLGGGQTTAAATFEGWAEPPLYTGKPAIYLNGSQTDEPLQLPVGTVVTVRVYGDASAATLSETVTQSQDTILPETEGDLKDTSFEVVQNGTITFAPSGGEALSWDISVIPDEAPTVELTDEISRTVQGALKMPFHAQDDYGVAGGSISISLQLDEVDRRYGLILDPEPRDHVVFDLPMPFNRTSNSFEDTVIEDLAEHPWAGLPVKITLSVTDDAGQTGAIEPVVVPMPGKRFFDTLAGAIAEQRRDLLWNRDNAERISLVLKAVTHQPDEIFENDKAYLIVRTALRRLDYNRKNGLSDEIRDDIADLLWKAAILIEDGDLADARERLKRAQERLSEAMKNGATDDEIAELMEELRKATQQYIRQLAREQRDNPDRQQADNQNTQTLSQDQIQQMMDRIQELMEQGRMEEAQALLQQLQEMMENLQVTEGGPGEDGDESQQSMEELQDTLREQQELADETFRRLQEEFNQNRQQGQQQGGQQQDGQNGNQLGESGQSGEDSGGNQQSAEGLGQEQGVGPGELAERQQALRDLLEQQRGRLPGGDGEDGEGYRESIEEAERKMGQAGEDLADGNVEGALDNQADAMESLREGMRQLGEANRQANARQNNGQGQRGSRSNGERRDPLGRDFSQSGSADTNDGLAPTDDIFRRSREILDEIRRRSGDRTRPVLELDYLKRLLDRF